jgi:2-keto-4-pentenoate hydratase/2-oxohepta-3-ene-1,7-dioic acid hydratase in catechol pathway
MLNFEYILKNFEKRMKTARVEGTNKEFQVGKILCLGRNYAEHAKEMKAEVPSTPVVFLKPSSAIIRNNENITIPRISKEPHHEVELVVAIGKTGKNINANTARQHILGYGIGLDMTLRDIQNEAKEKGLPWSVAKGFDSSAPISDFIPSERIKDPHDLTIRCTVNGTMRQQSSTKEMIFSIDQIIEFTSSIFTLEPGDLIFTGTPEGVSRVNNGDIIEAELVGFTKISHRVTFA